MRPTPNKDWLSLYMFLILLWVTALILILGNAAVAPAVSNMPLCSQAPGPDHTGKITCDKYP